jgi:hypothetical protein
MRGTNYDWIRSERERVEGGIRNENNEERKVCKAYKVK